MMTWRRVGLILSGKDGKLPGESELIMVDQG